MTTQTAQVIDPATHRELRGRIDRYEATRERLYPKQSGLSPDEVQHIVEVARIDREPVNEERSAVEVYEFVHDPPDKYFLYIDEKNRKAATWMGDVLGDVGFGTPYRSNMGDQRVPVSVHGINGLMYHGTYFKSRGDYARIKLAKRQPRRA